jgi:hypothetical protein
MLAAGRTLEAHHMQQRPRPKILDIFKQNKFKFRVYSSRKMSGWNLKPFYETGSTSGIALKKSVCFEAVL